VLKPENRKDKGRFEELKKNEEARGRSNQSSTKVAAKEVKELRKREGRSKDS
jgi:hypothetical protein